MSDQKKINYLATLLSAAFIIISIFTYLLTDNRAEWYLRLLNNLVPELLGPLIAILFIYFVFTKRGISIFKPETSDRNSNYTISIADIPVDSFGITITSHHNNAKVDKVSEFCGKFEKLPPNVRIRIYVVNENQSLCWVSSQDVIIDKIKKTWRSTVHVGGLKQNREIYHVVVALEDDATDLWIEYYKRVSNEIKDWKPLKYPLPKSIVETNKIEVARR